MNLKAIASSIRSLAKTIAEMELPEVKTFDRTKLETTYAEMGMENFGPLVDKAEAAFLAKFGDGETQNKLAVREAINAHFRALFAEHGLDNLATSRAPGERKERVSLTDAQKEEAVALRRAYLAEKVKPEKEQDTKVMSDGQAGNIAKRFNVSPPTLQLIFDKAGLVNKRTTKAE
jgi:hypothetical protein